MLHISTEHYINHKWDTERERKNETAIQWKYFHKKANTEETKLNYNSYYCGPPDNNSEHFMALGSKRGRKPCRLQQGCKLLLFYISVNLAEQETKQTIHNGEDETNKTKKLPKITNNSPTAVFNL